VSFVTPNALSSEPDLEPLDVLIAEDEEDSRDALQSAVRSLGHSCRAARDGVEALAMHEATRADVILSDWKMPRMSGLELCRRVREDDTARSYTHFIFVTANGDKAHFIHGMHAGADDYIAKPVDMDELQARLVAARRVVFLHRELRERNSSLRHDSERSHVAARTDRLTDAFNRLALEEDLETLAARALRYGHEYCAALCDIDDFKKYNDHFGHLAGDDALRVIARNIRGALRRGDVFYRYGGEEFLAILPEQSLREATLGMDRVRRTIERLAIPHAPDAGRPFVTISVGISALDASSDGAIDAWLRRTDAALYLAKARGRNCVAAEDDA
jgi:two-component system cell cycle response regulator